MRPRISPIVTNVRYSKLARETGYTRTHVYRCLHGLNRMSVPMLAAIADALNLSLDEIYWHVEAVKEAQRIAYERNVGVTSKAELKRLERSRREIA